MKSHAILLILAVIGLATILCGQVPRAELQSHVDQFWAQRLRSCDGLWYSAHYTGTSKHDQQLDAYIEYKDARWLTTPYPISQVDSLNGVQWRGNTTLVATANRWAPGKGAEWGPWQNGAGQNNEAVEVTKINGVWTITTGPARLLQGIAALGAPSCEAVHEHLRLQAGMAAPRQQTRNREQLGLSLVNAVKYDDDL